MPQKTIHRLRIELKDIQPKIWRRIEVPSTYTFWDLHCAIQDAMGWFDTHLHDFRIGPRRDVLISMDDEDMPGSLVEWKTPIADHLAAKGDKALYTYDFGDDWGHDVSVVAIAPQATGVSYPVCVDGRRACPPEDCGGPWGYEEMIAALADPKHEQHEEMREWAGKFDPEDFDPSGVSFYDPRQKLKAWQEYGSL